MQMVISPPFFKFSVSCSLSAFAFEFSLPTLPPAAAPSASSDLPLPGELSFSRVLAVSRCPSGTKFVLAQLWNYRYVSLNSQKWRGFATRNLCCQYRQRQPAVPEDVIMKVAHDPDLQTADDNGDDATLHTRPRLTTFSEELNPLVSNEFVLIFPLFLGTPHPQTWPHN